MELQQTCVTVTTKYLRERRPIVKSFLQAYWKVCTVYDGPGVFRSGAKSTAGDDKEILDDAYTFYAQRLQKIRRPPSRDKIYLDEMAEKQPRARNVAPESFVDLSLLQELDQNGFFKQLWKN